MYGNVSGASGAAQRLDSLVGSLLSSAPNALIVVGQITPLSDSGREAIVKAYNSAVTTYMNSRISKGQHVLLVDMHTNFPTSELADGTHPNSAGYSRMASVWYAAIKKYLH
jgi:lysophospholipase L1-like esterase